MASAQLRLIANGGALMSNEPALTTATPDAWAAAADAQRRTAELREQVVRPLVAIVEGGASVTNVVKLFAAQADAGMISGPIAHAMAALGTDALSQPTLKRWVAAYLKDGKAGLLPKHTGRVRQDYGWERRATELYNQPSKPGFADVAWKLRGEGFAEATESRVKRYLKTLPATLGPMSPARIGQHLHRLRRQRFQRRDVSELLVGEIYAGDGHTADCYVAHPNTGKPFRPELTVFIDIRSRYISGWYLTESESAVSTLLALSSAMVTHNHVPAWLYLDRGAGYRAQMLSDTATGWYAKFDIEVIGAIPGNPHGKGWIERFFRTVRDKHDKFFAGSQVYCGDDMAPEINRRLSAHLAQGKRTLPPLSEYVASFRAFLEQYHTTPMDVLDGATPAQLWAQLQPVDVGLDASAVMRPRQECTVRRQEVRLHNRFYFHEALALFDGRRVVVEYDIHNDQQVWIQDDKGRPICTATLVNTIGVLPTSRMDEQRDKRLQGQLKRLEIKVDEARSRRDDAITVNDQVRAIESLQPESLPDLETHGTSQKPAGADDDFDIDLTAWRDE